MSYSLLETLRKIVREELAALRVAELGVVQEIHPHASDGDSDNYACSVALRDSQLVLRQVPVASARAGLASMPDVGHLVLVQFLGGDINAPVITGSLYNDEDRPPLNDAGQAVLHLPSGAGDSDAVHLEVSSAEARQVLLKVGDALELTLQDDDPVVQIDVDGGGALVRIDRDGAVTVESQGDIAFKAGNAMKLEAAGELALEGATVNVKGNVINLN